MGTLPESASAHTDGLTSEPAARRAAPRKSVLQGATIYAPGDMPIACVVRNRSDGGAQLIVNNPGLLPDGFDLRIGTEAPERCQVVWRNHGLIGVALERDPRSAPGAGSDRRGSARKRALRSGTIAFNRGHSTMACRIVDLSDGGALLRPLSPTACPKEFDLIVSGAARRRCLVVRRSGEDLGVRFLGAAAP